MRVGRADAANPSDFLRRVFALGKESNLRQLAIDGCGEECIEFLLIVRQDILLLDMLDANDRRFNFVPPRSRMRHSITRGLSNPYPFPRCRGTAFTGWIPSSRSRAGRAWHPWS
jgi:hypothetical protein